jgi:hypothetical protein
MVDSVANRAFRSNAGDRTPAPLSDRGEGLDTEKDVQFVVAPIFRIAGEDDLTLKSRAVRFSPPPAL